MRNFYQSGLAQSNEVGENVKNFLEEEDVMAYTMLVAVIF